MSAREVVLQSMKKDLKALVDRGPVRSLAFLGYKPNRALVRDCRGTVRTEAAAIADILAESAQSQAEVHAQRVAHAESRIARYEAGGQILG